MKRTLFYTLSLAVAGGALVGCDQEETIACTTNADCGAYKCEIADGATEGVCAVNCGTGGSSCNAGFVCGGATATECVATTQTCADIEESCGAYACDPATVACFASCTAEAGCAEGAQCDIAEGATSGTCAVITADPYMYVAVVSTAMGADALNNPNPGPDLDAVSVTAGGRTVFADRVESSMMGEEGDRENTRTDFSAIVNGTDTLGNAANECNLDAQPGYTAIGGTGGYVVVSFGTTEIASNDTVTVYEINSENCTEAETERPDTYEVYITADATAARSPGTAADIRREWCLVGTQGGTGGTGTFTFDATACEE